MRPRQLTRIPEELLCTVEKYVKAITVVDWHVSSSDAGRFSRIHMLVVIANHYGDHMVLFSNR
jgi:hypothetical protein